MNYVQAPDACEMSAADQKQVAEALDPPMTLLLSAGGAYAAFFAGLRRSPQMRARPLVLQFFACAPAGVVLCLGGLWRSYDLLQSLMRRNTESTPLGRELRA